MRGMKLHRNPWIRLSLRCIVLLGGAMLIGLAISPIFQINEPLDQAAIVGGCLAVAWYSGMWFIGAKWRCEMYQQHEEEEREWNRTVNSGCRTHAPPERN